jgi:hypothetical protein
VSNTWDYRFAFRVEGREDVPTEFRGTYDLRLGECGSPVFGLFSPAMEDPGFILSHWLPPKLILLFSESLVLLSLDPRSDQVLSFELSRQDFVGYSLGEFLLNCWFTLYPGPAADGGVQIRFPSRVSQHYVELARILLNWSDREDGALRNSLQSSRAIPGLPPKFSSFFEGHTEFGPASEFFFQPAMELRKKRGGRWANVLLLITWDGIVALTDQYRGESSQYGIEMTYFPLRRVTSVDWIESADGHEAEIQVCLRGIEAELRHSWPVFSGLKPNALRWSKAAESSVMALARQYNRPEASGGQRGEYESDSGPLQGRDSNHARSRSD